MIFSVVILIESRIALEIGLWTCLWGTVLIAIEEGVSIPTVCTAILRMGAWTM